jgi:hypothetical protein
MVPIWVNNKFGMSQSVTYQELVKLALAKYTELV